MPPPAVDTLRSEAGGEWIRGAREGVDRTERGDDRLAAPAAFRSEHHRRYGNPHLEHDADGRIVGPRTPVNNEAGERYMDDVIARTGFVVESYGEHPGHAVSTRADTTDPGPAGRTAIAGNPEEYDSSYRSPTGKPVLRTADRFIDGLFFEYKTPESGNVGNFVSRQLGKKAVEFERSGTQADRFVVNLDSQAEGFRGTSRERAYDVEDLREKIANSGNRESIKEVLAVRDEKIVPVWPPPPGWMTRRDRMRAERDRPE